MSYSQNMENNIQSFNCSMPISKEHSTEPSTEINHTRGGYLYKIINNLIISRPGVFAPYLLNNDDFKRALIQNSQCKSIAMLVITLITLPQQNPVTTAQMPGNGLNIQSDNTSQTKKYLETSEQTHEKRTEIFGEVVSRCAQTACDDNMEDLHNNLCYVINNMFLREFNDKKTWVVLIFEKYLDELMESYLKNEEGNIGNKLGMVIYSVVDTMLNKTAKMEIEVSPEVWAVLKKYVKRMIQFLVVQARTYHETAW